MKSIIQMQHDRSYGPDKELLFMRTLTLKMTLDQGDMSLFIESLYAHCDLDLENMPLSQGHVTSSDNGQQIEWSIQM